MPSDYDAPVGQGRPWGGCVRPGDSAEVVFLVAGRRMNRHPLDDPPEEEASGAQVGAPPARDPMRAGRRIVKGGVVLGVTGILITVVGAVLLNLGPGPWETAGDVVHRGGMMALLSALVVVLVGYRWHVLVELSASVPARVSSTGDSAESRDTVKSLLATLPESARRVPEGSFAPAAVGADPPRDAEGMGPAPRVPDHVPPGVTAPAAAVGQPTLSRDDGAAPPVERGDALPPLSPEGWGCLVAAWTVLGLVLLFALLIYWVVPIRTALLISLVIDVTLAVLTLGAAVTWRGRQRAFALGAFLQLAVMLVGKSAFLHQISFLPWGGGMMGGFGPSWEWRFIDLLMHVLVPVSGFGGWLAASTCAAIEQASTRSRGRGAR